MDDSSDGLPILACPVVTSRQSLWDPSHRPPSPLNHVSRRGGAPTPPRTCAQEASTSPYGAIPSACPAPLRRYNSVTSSAPPNSALPASSAAPKSPLFRTPSLGAPPRMSAAKEQAMPPMFLPPTPSENLPIAVPLYIPPNHLPAERSFAPSPAYEQQRAQQRGQPMRGTAGPPASRRAPPIPRHSSLPLAPSAYPSGNYTPAVASAACANAAGNPPRYPADHGGNCGNPVTNRYANQKGGAKGGGWDRMSVIQRSTSAPVADDSAWEEHRGPAEEAEDWEEEEEEAEMGEDEMMTAQGEGDRGGMRGGEGWGVNARGYARNRGTAECATAEWGGGEESGRQQGRQQVDRSYLNPPYAQQQQEQQYSQQQQQRLGRHQSLEPRYSENRSSPKRDGDRAEGQEAASASLQRQASDGQCLTRNSGGYYGRVGGGGGGTGGGTGGGGGVGGFGGGGKQSPDGQRRQPDRRNLDSMFVDRSEPDRERLIELRLRRMERRKQQQWHHERQRKAGYLGGPGQLARAQMEQRKQWQLWRLQQQQQEEEQQRQEQEQETYHQQQQQQQEERSEQDEYGEQRQSSPPYQESTPPYQQSTSPYQQSTSPYHQSTSPYQQSMSPCQQTSSPYQQNPPPYKQTTSPYEQSTSPFTKTAPEHQSVSHRTRSLPQQWAGAPPHTDHHNCPNPSSNCPSSTTLHRTASDGRAITSQGGVTASDQAVPDQVTPIQVVSGQVVSGQVLSNQVVPQLLPNRSLRQLRRTPAVDLEAFQEGSQRHWEETGAAQRQQQQQQRGEEEEMQRQGQQEADKFQECEDYPAAVPCHARPSPRFCPVPPVSTSPPPLFPSSSSSSSAFSHAQAVPCSPPEPTDTATCHSPTGTAICFSPSSSSSSFAWEGLGQELGGRGRLGMGCFAPSCWTRN